LYAYILSQLIPALSKKRCRWRAKVEGAIDMHLGQIPERGEWNSVAVQHQSTSISTPAFVLD
jgi:hypothetical protein